MMADALRCRAGNSAAFARALATIEPALKSQTFPLAGGHVVLCGAGTYMNEAQAAGLDDQMSDADFEQLEAAAGAVGVPAAVEVAPASHQATRERAARRGYVAGGQVSVLRRRIDSTSVQPRTDAFLIETAHTQLAAWQETAALGWGHVTADARAASDAFATAAVIVDGDGMILARDPDDLRPVACASLTVNGSIAMLGGMSTVPAERRRGAQAAMIRHRLQVAHAAGCTLALSTTQPGSDSERNLVKHGFEQWFHITKLVRQA